MYYLRDEVGEVFDSSDSLDGILSKLEDASCRYYRTDLMEAVDEKGKVLATTKGKTYGYTLLNEA